MEADGGGDPGRGTDGGGDPDEGRWRWRRCGRGPSDPDPGLRVVAIAVEPGWKHWNLLTRRGGTVRGLPSVVPMEEEKNRGGAHRGSTTRLPSVTPVPPWKTRCWPRYLPWSGARRGGMTEKEREGEERGLRQEKKIRTGGEDKK
jgi:hypothetical protein